MTDDKDDRYWFAAKQYGWGWSFPATGQGWLVVAIYFALIFGGVLFLRAYPSAWPLRIWVVAVSIVLVVIVVAKGERPVKWRWGRDETGD